jgi:hypothetical protein
MYSDFLVKCADSPSHLDFKFQIKCEPVTSYIRKKCAVTNLISNSRNQASMRFTPQGRSYQFQGEAARGRLLPGAIGDTTNLVRVRGFVKGWPSPPRHPIDEIQDLARDAGVHRADREQLGHMIVPEALSEAWPDTVFLDEL